MEIWNTAFTPARWQSPAMAPATVALPGASAQASGGLPPRPSCAAAAWAAGTMAQRADGRAFFVVENLDYRASISTLPTSFKTS